MYEKNKEKINQCIGELIKMFRTNNIPQVIAIATHPRFNVPSNNWSLGNKIIQLLHGTCDARGFRQWKESGRFVKRDSRSFSIFAPITYKSYQCICEKYLKKEEIKTGKCSRCNENIVEEEIKTITSFIPIPVFRAEDTDGKPLDYEQIPIPKHRFMDVAKSWNLNIRAIAFNGIKLGHYRPKTEIALASPDELVFYHELAHAAHDRLDLIRKKRSDRAVNEIVAEFAGTALCYMDNKNTDKLGHSYEYLKEYANTLGLPVEKAVMKFLSEIEGVIKLILDEEDKLQSNLFSGCSELNPVSTCL
jgi:hypothetical protein